jgi:hypothetical protein
LIAAQPSLFLPGYGFFISFMPYLMTHWLLDDRLIDEWWSRKDLEGSDYGLIWGTVPAFAWRDWGKTWKASVRMVDVLWKIENETSLKYKSRPFTCRPICLVPVYGIVTSINQVYVESIEIRVWLHCGWGKWRVYSELQ